MTRRWVWLLIGGLTACAGTETGNPSFDGTLSYNTHTTDASRVALLQADPGVLVVDNAWLVLGDVGFVQGAMCDADARAAQHATGLGVGDHATPAAAETAFMLSEGRYCGVHLPFVHPPEVLPADLPSEIAGHSVLIDGTLADGRRFLLSSAFEGDVFLSALDGSFELDALSSNVLVGFDVAIWLGALDWQSATEESDGSVVVDETHNQDLRIAFEDNLALGMSLYRDDDGLGQITDASQKIAAGTP